MNILVCVKQVPDTTEIKIDPVKNTLIRDGVPSILNPFDGYALEAAARTPGGGDVCCRIHLTQGFLSISCENSYDGQLAQGEDGALRTTKPTRRSTASACGRCGWWRRSTTASWTFTTPGSASPSRPL